MFASVYTQQKFLSCKKNKTKKTNRQCRYHNLLWGVVTFCKAGVAKLMDSPSHRKIRLNQIHSWQRQTSLLFILFLHYTLAISHKYSVSLIFLFGKILSKKIDTRYIDRDITAYSMQASNKCWITCIYNCRITYLLNCNCND